MTRAQSVANSQSILMEAVEERNWPAIDVAHKRLSAILLEALLDKAVDEVEAVKAVFAEAFAKIVLLNDIGVGPSPERAAWSLNSAAIISEVAETLVPALTASDQAGAADRILQLLDRSNIGHLTNKDLADQCSLAEETVARTLPKLVSQNKVRSWKSGRARFNEITPFGREHLRKSERPYALNVPMARDIDYTASIIDPQFRAQNEVGRRYVFIDTDPNLSSRYIKNDTLIDLPSSGSVPEVKPEFLAAPAFRFKEERRDNQISQRFSSRVSIK